MSKTNQNMLSRLLPKIQEAHTHSFIKSVDSSTTVIHAPNFPQYCTFVSFLEFALSPVMRGTPYTTQTPTGQDVRNDGFRIKVGDQTVVVTANHGVKSDPTIKVDGKSTFRMHITSLLIKAIKEQEKYPFDQMLPMEDFDKALKEARAEAKLIETGQKPVFQAKNASPTKETETNTLGGEALRLTISHVAEATMNIYLDPSKKGKNAKKHTSSIFTTEELNTLEKLMEETAKAKFTTFQGAITALLTTEIQATMGAISQVPTDYTLLTSKKDIPRLKLFHDKLKADILSIQRGELPTWLIVDKTQCQTLYHVLKKSDSTTAVPSILAALDTFSQDFTATIEKTLQAHNALRRRKKTHKEQLRPARPRCTG
jgi:hypothetical protein